MRTKKASKPLMRVLYDSRLVLGWYIELCESSRVPRAIEAKIRASMGVTRG
jgi:hypothetical protein